MDPTDHDRVLFVIKTTSCYVTAVFKQVKHNWRVLLWFLEMGGVKRLRWWFTIRAPVSEAC